MVLISCQTDYDDLTDEEKRSVEYATYGLDTRSGLETTLFAAEDMVVNPTNMDIDSQGRVWVTEGVNYRPDLNPDNPVKDGGDRIVVLEDTDGDGRADSSSVFYQGHDIDSALGILVLDHEVIVSRSPDVFILKDTNGDGEADEKEVLFTGIGGEQHDHGVHAFVFGPDGKLYFNFGDAGTTIKDKNGEVITDRFGRDVTNDGNPYRKGMVFRIDRDGGNFEVLGHNFRNNYEVALDSYGTLWQSDNDDDGNRAVRINYVMEYGNYGYTDELTGAGWRTRRTGMAEDIPTRHWYQNDPGVVPNLLQTGAGSPTGILIYEGRLLPEVFWDQMIHADAGPNIIRSYPVEKAGAGYSATIEDILKGDKDQWFRPSDVTIAPDGSLFAADWYDPGVGGHHVGDLQKGRIFRIAPPNTGYEIPEFDFETPEGAVQALKNPNMNVRTKAWLSLHQGGEEAESALLELWNSDNPRERARALWLLSKIEGKGTDYIDQALRDSDPDIRITGLRAARQLELDIIPYVERLVSDSAPEVRREAALALHGNSSEKAPELWANLAVQHDGRDRWQLEALGIGATGQWDRFFDAWLESGTERYSPAGQDIIWRSRAGKALPMLINLINDPSTDADEKVRYFRALDFHDAPDKQQQIVSLLNGNHPDQQEIEILALNHLESSAYGEFSEVKPALDKALVASKGTYQFLDLVEKFNLETENEELVNLMQSFPDSSLGISAARLAIRNGGQERIYNLLQSDGSVDKTVLVQTLGRTDYQEAMDLLESVALDEQQDMTLRNEAVRSFSFGWAGENKLADMAVKQKIPASLQEAAAEVLSSAWRNEIRDIARQYLSAGGNQRQEPLPAISELVSLEGDAAKGHEVFLQACQACHQVNGEGIPFGPGLSDIGAKLPREGLYEAIIQPNAGVSFGYEGYVISLANGSTVTGIIQSETESGITLLIPGGSERTFDISEITSREQMEASLMPDLSAALEQQDLVDLIEYLSSLE
ncbi:MAG: PVC-type heme-binding CxxCH protein [Balneolaceae bacterium]